MDDTNDEARVADQAQEQILYKAEEAAKIVQLTAYWLRSRAGKGLIPHRRVGRLLRFAREDLEAIKDMSAQPAKAGRESA
ncbi:helix-turn-helix domain-containing protein [Nonomuraea sp. NPDC050153]|uniref:helix-turn-helix domain-containing protein n=1 Tax=Nonomuraea sp. NPDC050153 TaxID=3364359 RepID=UPI003795A02A